MKVYKRRFTPHTAELISHLVPSVKASIRALCDLLLNDPFIGKLLKGDLEGFYSVRHNRYRVIYRVDIEKNLLIIEYVGHRFNVYDLFSKLVKGRKHAQ